MRLRLRASSPILGAAIIFALIVAGPAAAANQYIINEDELASGQVVVGSVPHLDKLVVRSTTPPTGDYIVDEPVTALLPTPNDPHYGSQYGPAYSKFNWVWPYNTATDVVVAVIDTGVTDANGDIGARLLPGYDFVNSDNDPADDHGHGTRVANIVAASVNNSIGIAGAAPGVKIMPVKVLSASGTGFTSSVLNGIYYSVDNGAKVINLSLGNMNGATIPYYQDAIDYASLHNVTTVCAAGNDGPSFPIAIPAYIDKCIAVGGHDSSGNRYAGTHSGPQLDIMAPGVSVRSCSNLGTCSSGNGTSYAAPYVAAAAALLIKNGMHPNNVEDRLRQTAIDAGAAGFDNLWGYGILDVASALQIPDPDSPCPGGKTRTPGGQCVAVSDTGTILNATALKSGGAAVEGVSLHKYRQISIQTTKKTYKYARPDLPAASNNPEEITLNWTSGNITIDGDSRLRGELIRVVATIGSKSETIRFKKAEPVQVLLATPVPVPGDDTISLTGGGTYRHVSAIGVLTSDDDWYVYYSPYYRWTAVGSLSLTNNSAIIVDSRLNGKTITNVSIYGYDYFWLHAWVGSVSVN